MLFKWLYVSCLILLIQNTTADINYISLPKPLNPLKPLGRLVDKTFDLVQFDNVFYNPITKLGLKSKLESLGRDRIFRIGFSGLPCECKNLTCGCCTGINLNILNFKNKVCTNFTYDPKDFAIKFKFIVNEKIVFENFVISARNPAPVCLPIYPPFLKFCVRFYDIYTSGKNLHACIDLETYAVQFPILVLHFNCVQIGADGISWMKPNSTVLQALAPEVDKPEINEPEVYDEVDFEINPTELPNNQNVLTLAEEDNIGQLKL